MQEHLLDEAQIIRKIRLCGEELFYDQQQQSSISYTFSDSSNNIQDRLKPFVKPIKATKKLNKQEFSYNSIRGRNKSQQKLSSSASNRYKLISPNIKRRIFNIYQEHKKFQTQKNKRKKTISPNKQYESTKPKYLQKAPIMRNLSGLIQKNMYNRMKTQIQHMKPPRPLSRQQRQQKWQQFLRKNSLWEQERQNSRIKAKISQNMKVCHQINTRPPRKSPPKMTVDDCLHKLRRQAERLKQKLQYYNFQPKLYQTQRNKRKNDKSKHKQKGLTKNNPQQLTQKKFTVVKNPKKQLQFMFN